MKRNLKELAALTAVFCCPTLALAQTEVSPSTAPAEISPLVTDRPDFTESAATIDAGRFQLEGGLTYERSGSARTVTAGELLARIGLNKRSELRVGVPSYLRVRDGGRANGLDDASLGVKYMLSSRPGHPVAIIVAASLPSGAKRVAERKFQPEAVLATGMDLSDKVGLGLNLGYGRPSGAGVRFSQLFASASFAFSLSDKVGAFTEVYAFNRTEAGGRTQKYGDVGLTYGLSDDLQLDARVGQGLWNRAGGPDYFYGVGISQRF